MARSPLFRKSIRLLQTAHLQLAAPKNTVPFSRELYWFCCRCLRFSALAAGAAIATTAISELPRWQTVWSHTSKNTYYFEDRAISEAELMHLLRPFAAQLATDVAFLEEDFGTCAPSAIDRSSPPPILWKPYLPSLLK